MDSIIVTEARRWIGTRFAHQGRRLKTATDPGGIDCLGLLIGVAAALNLKDRHGRPLIHSDEIDYSKLPNGQRLSDVLSHLLFPIPIHDTRAGDIALFRIDGNPQHLGIISNYLVPPPEGGRLGGGERRSRILEEVIWLSANHPLPASPLQGEELGMIHAYAPSRKVVEHRLDEEWKKKMVNLFRVP